MGYKKLQLLDVGLKNMVTLTPEINITVIWKRVRPKSCFELQQKIKLLERMNARLEKELELKDMKAELFDMMIDIAEKEYNIDIRKNSFPEQSVNMEKKNS